MKTLDVIKKAVEVIRGPMELRPRQIIISEEVLNTIAADILGQQREIEKLKSKLAISKSIARHYRKDARVLLKEQDEKAKEFLQEINDIRLTISPAMAWEIITSEQQEGR